MQKITSINFVKIITFYVLSTCFSTLLYAETNTVWIDVRSVLEHKISNIEGDIRLSHTDIADKVNELFPDKDTEIRLYCLSGGRAGKALTALNEAGYTNVQNVGGISDARKQRGLE